MLWIDALPATEEDLLALDAEVSAIATAESLTVANHLQRGREFAWQSLRAGLRVPASSLSREDSDWNTVLRPARSIDHLGMSQVVMDGRAPGDWSAVKQYVVWYCLGSFYRAATNRAADRYGDRLDGAEAMLRQLWSTFQQDGVPWVARPLPAPGAALDRAGTYGDDSLGTVAAAANPGGTFDVRVAWVAGTVRSALSPLATVTVGSGQAATVSIAGLIAPDGRRPEWAEPGEWASYGLADSWEVYAGVTGGALRRQNLSVLPLSTTSFTLPTTLLTNTSLPSSGQNPDGYLRIINRIRRG